MGIARTAEAQARIDIAIGIVNENLAEIDRVQAAMMKLRQEVNKVNRSMQRETTRYKENTAQKRIAATQLREQIATEKKNISNIKKSSNINEAARGRALKRHSEALELSKRQRVDNQLEMRDLQRKHREFQKRADSKKNALNQEMQMHGRTTQQIRHKNNAIKRGIGIDEKFVKSTRAFKMEWLGAMFAGMALQRVFGGYISQVSQMIGITDIFTIIMSMFLIPALIFLMPYLIKLLRWVTKLSPKTRLWIGLVMVGVTILGMLIMALSMVVLAFGSFAAILGGAAGAVIALIVVVVILVGTLVAGLASGAITVTDILWTMLYPIRAAIALFGRLFSLMGMIKGYAMGNDAEFGAHYSQYKTAINWGSLFPKVPNLARGGIVSRPTLAMIGESGPEAVVPLSGGDTFNNSINVDANVASSIDIDLLARSIFDKIQMMQGQRM